jgi:hypothetical protein
MVGNNKYVVGISRKPTYLLALAHIILMSPKQRLWSPSRDKDKAKDKD